MLYHKRRIQRKAENKSSLSVTAKVCLKIELELRERIKEVLLRNLFLISAFIISEINLSISLSYKYYDNIQKILAYYLK